MLKRRAPCQSSNTRRRNELVRGGSSSTLHILFSLVDNKRIASMCFLFILLVLVPDDSDL